MKRKLTMFLILFLSGIGIMMAQTMRITGTVISQEDNEPVIGAAVVVKGTTIGTVTNFDGTFFLDVPSSAKTLVVSFIGMEKQEVAIQPVVKVVMKSDTQTLQEVIVTGYGVTRKVAFTGAAQTVDNKVVTQTTNADLVRSLEGSVAGFKMSSETGQPGGFNSVLIRGLGSFNSGTQPLYVIDGVPMTTDKFGMRAEERATINPIASLNPNDIESVSILKDATATAIYGARAANGVIVLTTKKGKSGSTKVNFSTKLGSSMLPARNNYRQLNASEWSDFIGHLGKNSKHLDKTDPASIQKFITDDLGIAVDPNSDTDWYDEVTRSGFTQEYNLDISGGNEKLRYFVSGGYYDEIGIVIGKDMKRYSGRLNLENQISKHVTFGINTTASYSNINNGAGGGYFSDPITQAYMQLPVQPVRKADGSWNMNTSNGYNPIAQRSELGDRNNAKQFKAIISPWVRINFLDDFTFVSRYGMDYQNIKEFGRWSMLQPQGKDMRMLGEEGNNYITLWTWTNTLNWTRSFDKHNFNVMIAHEAQKAQEENAYLAGSNFPTDIVFTVENAAKPSEASTSLANYALMSFFGNMEYDFNNKYYLSGSLRRDGSSRFGANNKWATFWSLGAKYRMINESFMESTQNWLSNLTLRSSYGTTGNHDIGWYQAIGLYKFGYNYLNMPGMVPTQIANPDLRWEQSKKFNVGIEVGFFNRVTLDVDYYINRTTDMLFAVPLSYSTGFSSIMKNVGEMKNKGIEAVIGVTPINTSNFNWNLSLNLTHNKNEIVKLSTDQPIEGTYTIREAGRPYHTFKMKEYAGVDPKTGQQLWYKGTEGTETTTKYNEAGKRYLGEADPKLYGGLTNNFKIYDFDLTVQFNYSFGGKLYNSAARYDENTRNYFGNTTLYVYENMWKKEGDITDVPAPLYGSNNSHSSRYLMNGSFIKMKNLQLGYTLPKSLINKMKLSSARIYVTGDNLFCWSLSSNFRGLDPETGADGIIWWNYPISRKLLFGVNLSF